jgi:hypothetical protein
VTGEFDALAAQQIAPSLGAKADLKIVAKKSFMLMTGIEPQP